MRYVEVSVLCYNVKRKARDDLPSLVVWPQPTTEKMGKTGAHIKKKAEGQREDTPRVSRGRASEETGGPASRLDPPSTTMTREDLRLPSENSYSYSTRSPVTRGRVISEQKGKMSGEGKHEQKQIHVQLDDTL